MRPAKNEVRPDGGDTADHEARSAVPRYAIPIRYGLVTTLGLRC